MPVVSLPRALRICFILLVAQRCAEASSLTQCVTSVTSDAGSCVQLSTDEPVSMMQLDVKTSQRRPAATPSSRANHTGNKPEGALGGDAGGSGRANPDGGGSVRASLADMRAHSGVTVTQSSKSHSMAQSSASAKSNDTGFARSLQDYGHKAISKLPWATTFPSKEVLLLLPVMIVAGICLITVCVFACCGRSVPPLRFTSQENVKTKQSEQCTENQTKQKPFGTRDPGFRLFWPLPPLHGNHHGNHDHHGHHQHHPSQPPMTGWGQPVPWTPQPLLPPGGSTSHIILPPVPLHLMNPEMQTGMNLGIQGLPPGMQPAMHGMPLGMPPPGMQGMHPDEYDSDYEDDPAYEDYPNYATGMHAPLFTGIPPANGLNRQVVDMDMTTRGVVDTDHNDTGFYNPWDAGSALGSLAEAIDPTPHAYNPDGSQVADAQELPPGGSPSILQLPA